MNTASKVPYRVTIERKAGSTKWQVADTIEVDSVNRVTIPDALLTWIHAYGIAAGDTLTISIESAS